MSIFLGFQNSNRLIIPATSARMADLFTSKLLELSTHQKVNSVPDSNFHVINIKSASPETLSNHP